jgi:hypothetical protein
VFLLFPNAKPPDTPELVNKGNGHWVLSAKQETTLNGQKLPIGISLTLIGHAAE